MNTRRPGEFESEKYPHDAQTEAVIGAAIEVHRTLGPGFLESIYEEALCIELELRGIAFARQRSVPLQYKGRAIGVDRPDLIIEESLIVDLKAIEALKGIHRAQIISYLRATGLKRGLLINFNELLLKDGIQRISC